MSFRQPDIKIWFGLVWCWQARHPATGSISIMPESNRNAGFNRTGTVPNPRWEYKTVWSSAIDIKSFWSLECCESLLVLALTKERWENHK